MCNGLFRESTPGHVSHTAMSALMAQNTIGGVNAVVGHIIDDIYPASCKVADSIEKFPVPGDRLLETPFALANGAKEPFFEFIARDKMRVERFHEAMKALNQSGPCSGEVMAKGYDWSEWKDRTLVDVSHEHCYSRTMSKSDDIRSPRSAVPLATQPLKSSKIPPSHASSSKTSQPTKSSNHKPHSQNTTKAELHSCSTTSSNRSLSKTQTLISSGSFFMIGLIRNVSRS